MSCASLLSTYVSTDPRLQDRKRSLDRTSPLLQEPFDESSDKHQSHTQHLVYPSGPNPASPNASAFESALKSAIAAQACFGKWGIRDMCTVAPHLCRAA